MHRPVGNGGRKVSVRSDGRERDLGIACRDHDLVVFLHIFGVDDPEGVLDDPDRVEWRGGRAHECNAA